MRRIVILFSIVMLCAGYTGIRTSKAQKLEKQYERFDGFYNTYDTTMTRCGRKNERFSDINSLVFFKGQRIHYNHGVSEGLSDYTDEYSKVTSSELVGKYRIVNDTIYATIKSVFYNGAGMMRFLDAHYTGYIKNRDTVLGWKMVPPYPKFKLKYNPSFTSDTSPKLMYFIKHEAVKNLEEIIR